ncbi:hypothetical protein PsorP6_008303 [Peronosclerospora sorghi]|uniref:Uncharacterized protein n=1 Tax=Peronosclerospora sorghi TaxID=230839 RepID=A0ACC0WAW0_9STRA|nr:hypothetical protein PsorP6_008303 [Peronosclerospora sorghi]
MIYFRGMTISARRFEAVAQENCRHVLHDQVVDTFSSRKLSNFTVDDQDSVRLKSLSSKVFRKRIFKVNAFHEEVRKGMKEKRFLLKFDGGTEGGEHHPRVRSNKAPDVFFLSFS